MERRSEAEGGTNVAGEVDLLFEEDEAKLEEKVADFKVIG